MMQIEEREASRASILDASASSRSGLAGREIQLIWQGLYLQIPDDEGLAKWKVISVNVGLPRENATQPMNEEDRRLLADLQGRAALIALKKSDLTGAKGADTEVGLPLRCFQPSCVWRQAPLPVGIFDCRPSLF